MTSAVSNNFANGDDDIHATIYFGVEGIDKEGVSRWDPVNIGKVIFDEKESSSENSLNYFDFS